MRALQFSTFGPVSNLRLLDLPDPEPDADTAVVKIAAASINPSDVKNVQGKMEHTTLPRVPGRDYAGTVIAGPDEWVGAEVWGTGGEIGYSIDGAHAELLAVPVASLRRKPRNISMPEAAAVGVTYVAAWLGLIECAGISPGETLVVTGANGGVGGSVAQLGKWRGARVIGLDRRPLAAGSPAEGALDAHFVLGAEPVEAVVERATGGGKAHVVFDTVGGPLFEPALKVLRHGGRMLVLASAGDRRVSFDLLDFYHNETRLLGIDTRARDAVASAAILQLLQPLFERGALLPAAIGRIVPLRDGPQAYNDMSAGTLSARAVLAPG